VHGPIRYCPRTALPRRAARGFSLVELLVVIAVIGLLIAAIVGIANVAVHNQKVRNTHAIMKNVTLAIDQFKEEDPLRLVYNGRNPTFGPYPPYQLYRPAPSDPNSVAVALEFDPPGPLGNLLVNRFGRDFLNNDRPSAALVRIDTADRAQRTNDDIRALYTYLKILMPSALAQVPDSALKPLSSQYEFVNPTGDTSNRQAEQRILGIHDAWGVPLDYLLYVKVEWGVRADGTTAVKIMDRIHVLRSRGISREVYDVQQNDLQAPRDPSNWIFSTDFPSPVCNRDNSSFWADGVFDTSGTPAQIVARNGWARVVGIGPPPTNREDYGYVPDLERDGNPP